MKKIVAMFRKWSPILLQLFRYAAEVNSVLARGDKWNQL